MTIKTNRRNFLKSAGLGVVADGEAHAALPVGVPGDGAREFAGFHRLDRLGDAVEADDGHLAGQTVLP